MIMLEFWGVSNRYSLNLCSEMSRSGVDLTLFTVEDCPVDTSPPHKMIRVFPSFSKNSGRFRKLLKYLDAYRKVISYAVRKKINLVHFQYFRISYADWIFLLIMRTMGIKIVFTAHNVIPHEAKPYHYFIFNLVYSLCNLVVVTSSYAAEKVRVQFGINPKRLRLIPIGNTGSLSATRIDQASARALLDISPEVFLLIQPGAIREYKGVDVLIEAVRLLNGGIKPLKCIVAGRADDQRLINDLRNRINNHGLNVIISIQDKFLSDNDIKVLVCASDLVVLPYKRASGQSAVLLLAYSFSKPVIVSRVGGLADMVEHEQSGFLVPPNDANCLAKVIGKAYLERRKLDGMGIRGRHINDTKYSWSSIARDTVRAYESLLD